MPNKKVLMLQNGDLPRTEAPMNEVVRQYTLQPSEYLVQPTDVLGVQVISTTDPEYDVFASVSSGTEDNTTASAGQQVDAQGNIAFPAIGRVRVSGKTLTQVEDTLQLLARKYVENPEVRVSLLNFKVSVLGEVEVPGVVPVPTGQINLPQAIAAVAGPTVDAMLSQVKIIRQQNGQASVYYVDMLDESLLGEETFFLQPNDIVVVPPARIRPVRRFYLANAQLGLAIITSVVLILNLASQ